VEGINFIVMVLLILLIKGDTPMMWSVILRMVDVHILLYQYQVWWSAIGGNGISTLNEFDFIPTWRKWLKQ